MERGIVTASGNTISTANAKDVRSVTNTTNSAEREATSNNDTVNGDKECINANVLDTLRTIAWTVILTIMNNGISAQIRNLWPSTPNADTNYGIKSGKMTTRTTRTATMRKSTIMIGEIDVMVVITVDTVVIIANKTKRINTDIIDDATKKMATTADRTTGNMIRTNKSSKMNRTGGTKRTITSMINNNNNNRTKTGTLLTSGMTTTTTEAMNNNRTLTST